MIAKPERPQLRCAIYTRKSIRQGIGQDMSV
jgi:hypothetical protein